VTQQQVTSEGMKIQDGWLFSSSLHCTPHQYIINMGVLRDVFSCESDIGRRLSIFLHVLGLSSISHLTFGCKGKRNICVYIHHIFSCNKPNYIFILRSIYLEYQAFNVEPTPNNIAFIADY
jgi:hypothetical protein